MTLDTDIRSKLLEARQLRLRGQISAARELASDLLRQAPGDVSALLFAGKLAIDANDNAQAIDCFDRALALEPKSVEILIDRGHAQRLDQRLINAITSFETALSLRPKDAAALRGLAASHLAAGHEQEALVTYRALNAVVPYDKQASHMIAALSGQSGSQAYVADLFDSYAEQFDSHLTRQLGYRIPAMLPDILATYLPLQSMLDIGCGTGLVGEALQSHVTHIDGIDIAPQMIRLARERDIYRHLKAGDATTIIENESAFAGPYDLAVAADVFVYLGRLESIFQAVERVIRSNGLMVFSIERDDRADVSLRVSGRFAHRAHYIVTLASTFGFNILIAHDIPVRLERDQPVSGMLYLLQKR